MLILLSTYNGERYLPEMLDSLLEQTYQEWRLIVRDDESTDNTLAILKAFAEKHPQKVAEIISDGQNLGPTRSFESLMTYAARNYPNEHYFMFADQDDIWLPLKIQHAYETITTAEKQSSDKPILVCTDLTVVDKELKVLNNSFAKFTGIRNDLLCKNQLIACSNYVTGCTTMFNRLALTCSCHFSPYALMHDHWTALKVIANKGVIIYLEQADILYRQHGTNALGATKQVHGKHYLIQHLSNFKQILQQNIQIYHQAHAALGMTWLGFVARKILYFVLRHIK